MAFPNSLAQSDFLQDTATLNASLVLGLEPFLTGFSVTAKCVFVAKGWIYVDTMEIKEMGLWFCPPTQSLSLTSFEQFALLCNTIDCRLFGQ